MTIQAAGTEMSRAASLGESGVMRQVARKQEQFKGEQDTIHEREFKAQAGKRPEIIGEANTMLQQGAENIRKDKNLDERQVNLDKSYAEIQGLPDVADKDTKLQAYNDQLKDYNADKTLCESVAAAAVSDEPNKPTLQNTKAKITGLLAVRSQAVARLNDIPQGPDYQQKFDSAALEIQRMTGVINQMNEMVQVRDPGVRAAAKRGVRQLALNVIGVSTPHDMSGVRSHLSGVDRNNWVQDVVLQKRMAVPSRSSARYSSETAQLLVRANEADKGAEGVKGEYRADVNAALRGVREDLFAQDAKIMAEEAKQAQAAAKAAETQIKPVAQAEAEAPKAAEAATTVTETSAESAEAKKARLKEEHEKYVAENGPGCLADLQKAGIKIEKQTQQQICDQIDKLTDDQVNQIGGRDKWKTTNALVIQRVDAGRETFHQIQAGKKALEAAAAKGVKPEDNQQVEAFVKKTGMSKADVLKFLAMMGMGIMVGTQQESAPVVV